MINQKNNQNLIKTKIKYVYNTPDSYPGSLGKQGNAE